MNAPRPTVVIGEPTRPTLEATDLTKTYGSTGGGVPHTALDRFDLSVAEGDFLGIMGPSGSGKTTLLNLLATIDTPTSGRLRIDGQDPTRLTNDDLARFRRRRLGFVFQDFNLLHTLSIRENVLLPLVLDRSPLRTMQDRLAQVSSDLGIEATLDRRPYQLSGGQQQRAAIARAIIGKPALVLADEPTGNLDSASASDVMGAFRTLNEVHGTTVIMVTHDAFAASYCKQVRFIRDGRPFSELRRGPNRQAFFQQLLDSLSLMGGTFA